MKLVAALLLLSVVALTSTAQTERYYPDNSCKVYRGGQEQTMAWCGGFNNPQFSMGDLNNDGLPDL
ncbi:MAG: hypothetical protein EBZ77_09550, partial [Chitinophagia bacterium]|nr:hypothetical protein [Chitinophagia bacterium]